MAKDLVIYIGYISLFSTILPLFFGYLNRKTLGAELRVLYLLLLISLLTDMVTVYLSANRINNLFLFHLYTFFEYVLLSYIFHLLFKDRKLSWLVLGCTLLLFAFSILDATWIHSLREMNTLTVFTESIILISYTGIFFYQFLQRLEFSDPLANPFFWFNAAVLFYFAGNLFLFIFSNYVLSEPSNMLWVINHVINILFKFILGMTFWKATDKTI